MQLLVDQTKKKLKIHELKFQEKSTDKFAAIVDGLTPRVNLKYWFLSTGFANVTSTIELSISLPNCE